MYNIAMINPLRKKTREHAEKMGLLDMAKKVEELVEAKTNLMGVL